MGGSVFRRGGVRRRHAPAPEPAAAPAPQQLTLESGNELGFGEESDALAQIYDMGGGTWSMEACVNVLKALPAEIAEKHISAWVGYCVDALVNDYEQYSAPQIDDDQALASPAASPLQEPQEPVRSFSSGGATSAGQQSFAGQPKTPIKTSIMPGQNPVNVLAESGRTAVGES